MSLRWRIALGLATIAAFVSAFGAAAAYVTTSRQLQHGIDESLVSRAATAGGPGTDESRRGPGDGDSEGSCPPPGAFQPASAAQLVTADATVRLCIDGAPELPVDATDRAMATEGGKPRLRTVTIGGTGYRVLTVPWHEGGVLQTARTLDEIESVQSSLRIRLLLVGLVGIAAAAILGWLFARRLVQPIERLRAVAERIARTQDLDAPVPHVGGGEVASLAGSFSTMVDALATSRRQQQRLITDASHEMRTPLTSLRTNAELLDRGDQLSAEQHHAAVQGIQLEVNELTHLVTELVELATDRADDDEQPESIHLADPAREVAELARRRTGRTVTVLDDHGTAVLARPHMTQRAISNLVDNALKYSPPDTAVEIVVSDRRIEVRDHGPGIAAADQPHVFDRFYRSVAARTEPGSGLGLAIVRQIVQRHGGTVWATTREEGGAAVGFELPETRTA